jgi:hypothetical protein
MYGDSVVCFEHGMDRSSPNLSGGCVDHAHLHLLPCGTALAESLKNKLSPSAGAGSLLELKQKYKSGPYILIKSDILNPKIQLLQCGDVFPSQYLRKLAASLAGRPSEWDWRDKPNERDFLKTLVDWNERED